MLKKIGKFFFVVVLLCTVVLSCFGCAAVDFKPASDLIAYKASIVNPPTSSNTYSTIHPLSWISLHYDDGNYFCYNYDYNTVFAPSPYTMNNSLPTKVDTFESYLADGDGGVTKVWLSSYLWKHSGGFPYVESSLFPVKNLEWDDLDGVYRFNQLSGKQIFHYEDFYMNVHSVMADGSYIYIEHPAGSITVTYSINYSFYSNDGKMVYKNESFKISYSDDGGVFYLNLFPTNSLLGIIENTLLGMADANTTKTVLVHSYDISFNFPTAKAWDVEGGSRYGLKMDLVYNNYLNSSSDYAYTLSDGTKLDKSIMPAPALMLPDKLATKVVYAESVTLNDFDLFSWLGDTIDSIFYIEVFPGVPLRMIFGASIGILLLISFLRVFKF